MSQLFSPLTLRGTTFPNRAWVSPMCQYSSVEGAPTSWHHVHLVSRAVGGAGLVMTEATAVNPQGRISPADAGLWTPEHAAAYAPITSGIRAAGSVPGIQLAHAGRKASVAPPWEGGGPVPPAEGGWTAVGPSAVPFGALPAPRELTEGDIAAIVGDFVRAARLAADAGFQVVEIHGAHGYLLHSFLSPLSNQRTDCYGGSFEHRVRLALEVTEAVRAEWTGPLFFRVSATDWAEGGWELADTVALAGLLAERGVDLLDASSGGLVPAAVIPVGPGYQVPFAAAVRAKTGLPTAAVGLITSPRQAEEILAGEAADAVLLAREQLRDPYWPRRAAAELGDSLPWPVQYERGAWPLPADSGSSGVRLGGRRGAMGSAS